MQKSLQKYVLIACEYSQVECTAFREVGAVAFSSDLLPAKSHPEWHVVGDCRQLVTTPVKFRTQDGKRHMVPHWDLIIAHPPCTYLSRAAAAYLYTNSELQPERYRLGLEAKAFFDECLAFPAPHVCVENPTPFKIFNLPPPDDIVQPYEHGHKWRKRTLLWLKNLPPLLPTLFVDKPRSFTYVKKGGKARSRSFEGIARAMASQWFPLI